MYRYTVKFNFRKKSANGMIKYKKDIKSAVNSFNNISKNRNIERLEVYQNAFILTLKSVDSLKQPTKAFNTLIRELGNKMTDIIDSQKHLFKCETINIERLDTDITETDTIKKVIEILESKDKVKIYELNKFLFN